MAQPDEGTKKRGRSWVKPAAAVAGIAVLMLLAGKLGLFDLLGRGSLKERVLHLDAFFQAVGPWAPAVFVAIWIVASVLLLPGLPVSIVGGLVFGAVWGSVWTTVGANLGAAAAFLIGRYAARGMVEGWVSRKRALKRIDDGVRRQGWRMLMITRLVPIFPFNIQNYVYGLTDIPLRTYVFVTLPCMLPGTIAYNFAAGSAREVILSGGQPAAIRRTLIYLAVAAAFFVLLSLIPGWMKRRYRGQGLLEEASPRS